MSSFGLKILALILMFIDHIAQFLQKCQSGCIGLDGWQLPFSSIVVSGVLHTPQTERNIF